MVTLESLVPDDHLLRKVDAVIDFGFIRELTEGLYCLDNGRPPIAPEVLFKTLSRHVWADARDRTDANRQTDWGKRLYARRKETVECSFADAKQLFGPRYARCRGLTGVKWQCLLVATAQNIKKIAAIIDRRRKISPV